MNTFAVKAYSTPELDELEKEFIKEINQSPLVIRDPLAMQYINRLGKILTDKANMPAPYFFLVNSNEINAFAGPGGYIGINSELILATENESELAAVMAHELAHVRLHHLYSRIEHEQQKKIPMIAAVLASLALGVLNPTLGSGALMATLSGFAEDGINFTRSKEKEADRIGIDMLHKANFNPRGMVGFFQKMQQASRYYYTNHIPAILRTHPLDEERITEAENRILQINLKHAKEYHNSVDYNLFKEIIRTSTVNDRKKLYDYYHTLCPDNDNNQACQYGKAITYLNMDKYQKAYDILIRLDTADNFYYKIALVHALRGLKQFDRTNNIMHELLENHPNNYPVTLYYSDHLIQSGENKKAVSFLLKANRTFKNDPVLCKRLARAQALSLMNGNAYFTQAHCELLQGRRKKALYQLGIAKKISKNDPIMQERIDAKIDELH